LAKRPRKAASRQHQDNHISRFPILDKRRQIKRKPSPPTQGGNIARGFDPAGLAELLQNPSVQTLIKKGLNNGVATKPAKPGKKQKGKAEKKNGLNNMLGGMDFVQLAKLLQNPMVQSMLKNIF
jgi:hypothetical protein